MEVAQLTYSLNRGNDDTGLPGTYYLGGFYSGAVYSSLSDGNTRKGNYGFYLEGQQMIYRRGGRSRSRLGARSAAWTTQCYGPWPGDDGRRSYASAGPAAGRHGDQDNQERE